MAQNKILLKSKYRSEIDGLRAFAVIAVIINHFDKEILPSGYLGVDIFFVISGFVITSSIFGRSYDDFGNFLSSFYFRRLRRIIPALTFFLIFTSFAVSAFCEHPSIYLKTALTASLGISNIYLYQTSTDYFASSTALNPFTQTWSLGVEQQFYFLFPILAWISGFSRHSKNGIKYFVLILGSLAIASLISFIYLYEVNQAAAYFLITSRFWEMAAGSLLFVGNRKNNKLLKSLKKIPSSLIVSLMIGTMLLPSNLASKSTICMVTLTSILINSFQERTIIFKLFTKKLILFIGLISYSLYLWHWGILSITKWTIGISASTIIPVAMIISLISLISYKVFEIPLRKSNLKNRVSLVLIFLMTSISINTSYFLGRLFIGKLYLGKNNKEESKDLFAQSCQNITSDFPDLIIVGDSHALNLYKALKQCIPGEKLNLTSVVSTPFPRVNFSNPYIIDKYQNNKNNINLNNRFKEVLNSKRKNATNEKTFIIANRNPMYFSPNNPTDGLLVPNTFWNDDYSSKISHKEVIELWIKKLIFFAENHSQDLVYVVLPAPEINTQNIPLSICKKEWFRKDIPVFCNDGVSMENALDARKDFFNSLKKAQSITNNIRIYDGFEDFCDPKLRNCKVKYSGNLIYKDSNHLSSYGYSLMIKRFLPILKSSSINFPNSK